MTINEDLILYVFFGTFALLAVIDFVAPAYRFPKMKYWRIYGMAFFAVTFVVSSYAPFLWDAWLAERTLIDASGLGLWAGALVAFIMLELSMYVWHRMVHGVDFLWRFLHQVHHSAERIDVWSANIFHPLDIAGFSLFGSLFAVGGIGVAPESALLAVLAVNLLALWQHANVKTPVWLGYFIVRPEMHMLHHQRGAHGYNYADLPVIDMIFGTFRNPTKWEGECGFFDGASRRLGDLLTGVDMSSPEAQGGPNAEAQTTVSLPAPARR